MFSILTNLAKAAVAVAVTPVALVVDVVTLPSKVGDLHSGPFDNTGDALAAAKRALEAAVRV